MTDNQKFTPGYWANGDQDLFLNFKVRYYPVSDVTGPDFLHNYCLSKGDSDPNSPPPAHQIEIVERGCELPHIMTMFDHSLTGRPDAEQTTQRYLRDFIDNPQAILLVSNFTEPLNKNLTAIMNTLVEAMDQDDLVNRLILTVPDSEVQFLVTDMLYANYGIDRKDLRIYQYSGHLMNFFQISKTNSEPKTPWQQPRRIGMLNGQHKPWRAYITYKLWEHMFIDKMQYSYWNKWGYSSATDIDADMFIADVLSTYTADPNGHQLNEEAFRDYLTHNMPLMAGLENRVYHNDTIPPSDRTNGEFPECLLESPIHIVPETLFDQRMGLDHFNHWAYEYQGLTETAFITEKTYRSIASGAAIIPLGLPGTIKKLHNLGFKTFNRWWDEEALERLSTDPGNLINNTVSRTKALTEIVGKIFHMNDLEFKHLMNEMKPTIDHNTRHLKKLQNIQNDNRLEIINNLYQWHYNE
jgi:hypothetical protein